MKEQSDNTPAPDDQGSAGTVSPDEASLDDALADILDDLETDTGEEEAGAEAQGEEAEDDGKTVDDDDAEESEGDEPKTEYAKGRFAADDARVRLSDGTTVTIAELKRGSLRQADYTRKTQSLAEERKTIEATQQRVTEVAQQLTQGHEQIAWWLEQLKPKRPEVAYSEDPVAHGEYQDAAARWQEASNYWQQQRQQDMSRLQAAQQERFNKYRDAENEALLAAIPALRDATKRAKFTQAAIEAAAEFGFTEQEVRSIADHRYLLVLRAAMAYQRLQAKVPRIKADLQAKPAMMRGSKRTTPKQANARTRQAKIERLKKEGTDEAAMSVLMDMDL